MGKRKYLDKIINLFEKSPVVDFDSIKRIVGDKKRIKQYTKQIIRNLIKQNRIKRITKGFYTIHEDPSLAVFCFSGYLGVQNALSFHNLWEQETVPVIITAKRLRSGRREVFGANVIIKKIDRKYFFGFEYQKDGDFYLPYSDIEKTFIDEIYFKLPMDEELIANFREKINKKKLREYLMKYPLRFRKIVLAKLKGK